jgi:hypothetical protein
MRFQEYYENPKFKGKIFTHEQFKKWYIKNSPTGKKTGKFTYNNDWWGFNMPSSVFKPFYNGKFDPLSDLEKTFLKRLKPYTNKKFYVITAFGKINMRILKHEIAHGLFYTNAGYRCEVMKILKTVPTKQKMQIFEFFKKHNGYHKDVWTDELHAYILSELELNYLRKKGIDVKQLWGIHRLLNENFKRYY